MNVSKVRIHDNSRVNDGTCVRVSRGKIVDTISNFQFTALDEEETLLALTKSNPDKFRYRSNLQCDRFFFVIFKKRAGVFYRV